MHRFAAIAMLVGALSMAPPALAAIYKWVDDEGVTQYTQQPPPDVEAERIEPVTGSSEPDGDADGDADAAETADAEDDADAQTDSDAPATMDEYCEQMREEAETLSSEDRVQVRQDDDTLVELSGEDREQRLAAAEAQIEEHCE